MEPHESSLYTLESNDSSTSGPLIIPHLVVCIPSDAKSGKMLEERYAIDQDQVLLGSASHAQVQIPHPVVQSEHAQIYWQEGQWYFRDLTVTLKVTVDGIIVRMFPLNKDGMAFYIGPLMCRFFLGTTDQSHYEQHLYHAARTDRLTQLANNDALMKRIHQDLARCTQNGLPLSVILLDLDHFHDLNEKYGHPGGDAALHTAAQRIVRQVRKLECVGRYGGEEMIVVMPNTQFVHAMETAERIRLALCSEPVLHKDRSIPISASLGVVTVNRWMETEELIAQADKEMYRAKDAGRNAVCGKNLTVESALSSTAAPPSDPLLP